MDMQRLQVADNSRFLVTEDGDPFFWLGDTAWELFHRLTRQDAERYFRNRVAKGFSVIQAVALGELRGVDTPNPYVEHALHDRDPERPNEAYFSHVDDLIAMAADLGLYTALLPTWGCYVVGDRGPKLFDEESARTYGRWLGERYAGCDNLIWVNGGDRLLEIDGVDYRPVRRYACWNLFAGGHGHTYGCLEAWQMYQPPSEPIDGARIHRQSTKSDGEWIEAGAHRALSPSTLLAGSIRETSRS